MIDLEISEKDIARLKIEELIYIFEDSEVVVDSKKEYKKGTKEYDAFISGLKLALKTLS